MTDPVEQRVGNLALNRATRAMCDTHPLMQDMTAAQRRLMLPTFVRRTSDAWLLTIPGLGDASLARLRAEWPYDPPPVTHCPCCNQPLPEPATPLGE